ncbi:MAG: hypothetical protein NTV48_02990 [Candidatus Vogelbacteria bacterium]|nr:hypothetical protein [Candidatus Vogelbacteria bacterium]
MDEDAFNNFFAKSKAVVENSTKEVLEWETPEHETPIRHPDWYWGAGAIVVFSIILCIIFGNFLLAIIILIGAFSLYMYEIRIPKMIKVKITNKGVILGHELYSYEKIKSFWITEEDEDSDNLPPKLLIYYDRSLMPTITIYLEEMSPTKVRAFLKKFGEEEKRPPSVSEAISGALGF